ncbi:hypothetical protein DENSPDRAFT_450759 [Dentipellis sp. KUC8613]|nr:hypothetical protein DENSPDRAFT_450759 [Dentipellis sp. KUC8613]
MARSVRARTRSVEERDDGSESPLDAGSGSDAEEQDLFVREEKPMKFFLYDISDDRAEGLTEKIEAHGGQVTSLENKAAIILVTKRKHYDVLKFKYDIVKDKWVHMSGWVDQCIERKKVLYPRPQFRNMGGTTAPKQGNSAPRRSPVAFTEEDRLNLCRWIATKVPYKNDGGRNGNKIYKELVERCEKFGQCPWAARHTWQAWKQHYKMKQDILDKIIDQLRGRAYPWRGGHAGARAGEGD